MEIGVQVGRFSGKIPPTGGFGKNPKGEKKVLEEKTKELEKLPIHHKEMPTIPNFTKEVRKPTQKSFTAREKKILAGNQKKIEGGSSSKRSKEWSSHMGRQILEPKPKSN